LPENTAFSIVARQGKGTKDQQDIEQKDRKLEKAHQTGVNQSDESKKLI
jgi:hypothetical protein